jgi:hypothetical protein
MSPGRSRRSSAPVCRSTRATPLTPGSSDRVRCDSPESFMHALTSGCGNTAQGTPEITGA